MLKRTVSRLIRPRRIVRAHCDLPCGVYDPAQARIEAESILAIQKKYQDAEKSKQESETADEFRERCIRIKEDRAELVKHHLWVLWTDYFNPEHKEQHGNLHDLFWQATKEAGESKRSTDPAQGQKLLNLIDQIGEIFTATKKAA
ncbi:MAG TPA: superoxide dismutase, Ni [Actinomycetota bacterium]|nr:superoxide dismutase, Ni [Actinomycetota bacterium]